MGQPIDSNLNLVSFHPEAPQRTAGVRPLTEQTIASNRLRPARTELAPPAALDTKHLPDRNRTDRAGH